MLTFSELMLTKLPVGDIKRFPGIIEGEKNINESFCDTLNKRNSSN